MCDHAPIKCYVWILKSEYHISFMCHKTLFFLFLSTISRMYKTFLKTMQTDQVWPASGSWLTPDLKSVILSLQLSFFIYKRKKINNILIKKTKGTHVRFKG